jgi:transposase-like protein
MEERLRFVHDALSDRFDMSELCARYGVSRRIGYKWLARYEADGRRGLVDQSRAPKHCPHRTADRLAELLVACRQLHPQWGARKLLKVPRRRHPEIEDWPAASTAADLLARRGLCGSDGGGGSTSIRAWSPLPPRRLTTSGPPTSRAGSGPATACTATHSRSPTSARPSW